MKGPPNEGHVIASGSATFVATAPDSGVRYAQVNG